MRRVESGDVTLAVVEEGDPARPTVVLLHGYPDTLRVWDEVAALLRDRFHVVRYDTRSAGDSTAPRDPTRHAFADLASDLAAVLETLGKPKVHLVGHDWGSLQGWDALSRPGLRERVASFTSLGGPGLAQAAHFLRHGRRRDVLGQLARSWYMAAFQLPVLPELAWSTFMPKLVERTLRAEGAEPRPGHPARTIRADGRRGLWLYRANTVRALGRGDVDRRVDPRVDPRVDAPVQIVECTRDGYASPALVASLERWPSRCWRRTVVAGHWAHRSRPDAVARMIAEFVTHIEGGPGALSAGAPASRGLRAARVRAGRRAFEDRLVVVTGAGDGIGRATARAFAAHGAEVVCADVDRATAARVAGEIGEDLGGTAHAAQVDVGNGAEMEAFSRNIVEEYGVPDIVVNNAGVATIGLFLHHGTDDWRRVLGADLWGVVHGCRLFGAQMAGRGEGGHLVNVASMAAYVPSALLPAYSAAKAAVKALSECLRAELAEQGVGVSVICPGFVSTGMARHATYLEEGVRGVAVKALDWRGYPPERVAAHILRAVHANLAVVPVNAEGKIGYALSRISPSAVRALAGLGVREIGKSRGNDRADGRR
uniref:SDR family oxidoreductase n=1 Tax=Nonomuraea pusilla TaxID=46177 RepID=UPI0006E36F45|nr:SDR family oxidoreductase [Nonomuraea pusilla]